MRQRSRTVGFQGLLLSAAILGHAPTQAQVVVGDPLNAAKTFSSYCSACHKSAAGLGKNMGAAGLSSFLRQHYTTGAQMSSVMSTYLLTARAEPRPAAEARRATGASGGEGDAAGQRKDQARTRPGADTPARTAARTQPGRPGAPESAAAPASTPAAAATEAPAPVESTLPTAALTLEKEREGKDAGAETAAAAPAPAPDQASFSAPSP